MERWPMLRDVRCRYHLGVLGAVALWLACQGIAFAATGKIIKTLPFYLDREGRHSLSPSLYDRDAYQAELRKKPEKRSGLRFDIQWKASGAANPVLKVELRGMKGKEPTARTLEAPARKGGLLGNWTSLSLKGDDYKNFGELAAWRATLWDGDQLLGEQKSFLW